MLAESGVEAWRRCRSPASSGATSPTTRGFVFEVLALSLGPASPVAGGGRYDGLLKAVGAPRDVPAVGGAIHTERLLAPCAEASA